MERKTKKEKNFTDPEFCKYYLVGFCPNELFLNTKMDIGECKKVHSDAMKRKYDAEIEKGKDYGFDFDLERYLERILEDVNRKRERAKKRLEDSEKTYELTSQEIAKLLKQAEQAGEDGKLEESKELLTKAEELKKKSTMEGPSIPVNNPVLASLGPDPMLQTRTQQQKLRVCDVCGLLLGVYEDEKRLADHYSGKLHIGVMKVIEQLDQLKKTLANRKAGKNDSRQDSDRKRDRERDRDRERERERDRRSDSRDEDRHYKKSRDRYDTILVSSTGSGEEHKL